MAPAAGPLSDSLEAPVFGVLRDLSTPTCVVIESGREITHAEVERLRAVVDAAVAAAGDEGASLVAKVDAFPRLEDLGAMVEAKVDLLADVLKLRRIAWVSDLSTVERSVELFGWMVAAEKRTFPVSQLDDAIAWARER